MSGAHIGSAAHIKRRRACQLDRPTGYLAFLQRALFCDGFGCMAVAVAGGKVHPAVRAAWIVQQRL
ncbi:MAG TPA: hypothetical protein VHN38_09815, partial [Immundisolibacter sp.]|nr:hypothetical protein [Immundisolibacter sp.]